MSNIIEILGTVTQGPAGVGGQQATGAGNFLISNGTGFGAWAENTPAQTRAALDLEVGTDVQAWDADLDTYSVNPLTAAELQQLQNINTTTITATQWGYVGSISAFGATLIDDADASAARSTLGLVIGTDVQAYDVELAALAGVTSAADKVPYFTGSGTADVADFSAFARTLVDDADASTARGTLGLGSIATQAASNVSVTGGTITGVDLTADSADLSAFSGDLSAIVGFTPVGVSYYDDTAYADIIRKGEESRSYYTETLNTATRGSRKEFPLRGAVAWSATQVAIVDLEGGQPEMWMVFNTGRDPANAEWGIPTNMLGTGDYAINDANINKGVLYAGEDRLSGSSPTFVVGLITIDFLADRSIAFGLSSATAGQGGQQEWQGNIAERNEEKVHVKISDTGLVNSNVNAVAISNPLDHYPLDEYGRPAFAIAAATDGGVSVILPDADNRGKRVTDSADTSSLNETVWWVGDFLYHGRIDDVRRSTLAAIEAGDGWTGFNEGFGLRDATGKVLVPHVSNADYVARYSATPYNGGSVSDILDATVGLGVVFEQSDAFGSLSAFLSSEAFSGWCPQGRDTGSLPVLALDFNAYAAGSVAASTPLDDDFTSYADQAAFEAVYDTYNTDGGANVVTLDAAADTVRVQSDGTLGTGFRILSLLDATQAYVYEIDITVTTGGLKVFTNGGDEISLTTTGVHYVTVTGETAFSIARNSGATDVLVNSVTIKRAAPDLSPANNGATINGTLTAAAVETGADLFALSGWSASNYLEVPYSSDFDFGTGDWFVATWVKDLDTFDTIFAYGDGDGAGNWSGGGVIWVTTDGNDNVDALISDDSRATTDTIVGSTPLNGDEYTFVAVVRRGSQVTIYLNAEIGASGTLTQAAGSLTNTSGTVRWGGQSHSGQNATASAAKFALSRVTKGYAPTPEQIRKMYRDEKKLFEASAKCLLPSDTVNSLDARDGLLLIGTEGGAVIHDVFKRLELLDSGDIGLTESGVDSVALLGGNDVALVTGSDVVARRAARDLAHPQVIDAYKYERAFSGKGYTTDATPTDIAKFPLAEGERVELRISVDAGSDDGTEYGTYTRVVRARRDINGNVTVTGTDTLGTDDETTAGMDVAFAADTTAQTVDLQVTGVASTNMQWSYEAVITLNKVV